jgi:hypothetical protein
LIARWSRARKFLAYPDINAEIPYKKDLKMQKALTLLQKGKISGIKGELVGRVGRGYYA